jgi:tetratricopeptide (TPR) repeat protein
MAATVSELPFVAKRKSANARTQTAASVPDSISLDKPVGPPTPQLLITMAQMCERNGDVPARMEDRQGDLRLAEHLYRQAVAANPQHAGALNDLGLCLARQGNLEASVQMIEQAIQLQPDKPLYRNNAATVFVEMRQDQRALAHLAAVHGSAEANYNLGQLFVQRGRAAEAAPYYHAAVEQNPQLQAAQVALAQLQGTSLPAAVTPATSPAVASDAADPASTPEMSPAQAPAMGPQLEYPATARSPEVGASSYVPPAYYAPTRPFASASGPRVGARPQYLPPVVSPPGTMQR